jgi:hypothetical protein
MALAGVASAARLNWNGTLTSRLGDLPDLVVTGGGVATVNGSSGSLGHLDTLRLAASRGAVTGTDLNIITDPETAGNGIAAVIIQFRPGTGTLGPISGAIASTSALTMNTLPIGGVARICILSTVCSNFIPLLLTENGTRGVGLGGLVVASAGAIRISVEAAPWTVKTATAIDQTDDNTGFAAFHNVTRMGFAHGPSSGTTSTATPSGVLQIVTPSQVRTNLSLGSSIKVATITELLIHFVPEPGLLFLLGSGVVGLVVLGRHRMRR